MLRLTPAPAQHDRPASRGRAHPAQMAPIQAVRAPYLAPAFAEADAKYGSFDAYVRQGLGLTDAQVAAPKAQYLVGAPAA